MTKSLILVLLFSLPLLTVQASGTNDFTLPKIQVVPIKDTRENRQYELYIKLPEEYEKHKDKSYPVLYFTDAIWHVELLSAATEFLLEEVILVGISWQKDISEDLQKELGAHVSRYRDYSINKSSNPERQAKYQFGQASNHLAFIRQDVIKHIEKNYRTQPDNRSYFGYSAGGLFGTYILMAQPDTFKNYILGSPSLWRNIPLLSELGAKAALKHKGLNANVFISYGTLEKELGEHIREFTQLLKSRNDNSLSLKHPVIEGSHQTAFPLTGVRSMTWLSNLTKAGAKS
ncbi:alpha/beta hydrolase [Thalassomonas actiniarum]|uniref:Alpha/beta hydrolase n=1 Tax=Thalassomonas actiniarum TaxID=485447 RepID=A0AAF0C3R7_9GAMM|nr:alpha/beta hydrolase-fold protein [Thalassomonas actiniarum]WDD99220.1 alpha/beta hydrolase [Thalassomonas actiniarum]